MPGIRREQQKWPTGHEGRVGKQLQLDILIDHRSNISSGK